MMILPAFAQSLTQQKNVAAQVGLFHKRVGPDGLHQVVFADNLRPITKQHEKDLESLGRKRDRLSGTKEQLFLRIDPERTELVEHSSLLLAN
jgi:hypothetical protein